jgi:hypothetical protein
MIDREAALPHHFFQVTIAKSITQIPAHAEKDDLEFIVTPLEEIIFGHRQTSEEDSGSGQSTTIDTRHPFFATQPKIPSCGRGAHSLMMHCLFLLRIDDLISDR